MLDFIKALPGLMKWKRICIDNNVFRLHYEVTTFLLVGLSFLLSSKQYFGDPIACMTKSAIPTNTLNSYCWMFSTFSVKKHMQDGVGIDLPHPGVAPYNDREDEVIHHKYYQWVCLVLFLQAWFFYMPHYIWKRMEGGIVRMLAGDELEYSLINDKWTDERKQKIADYLTGSHLHRHASYAFKFTLAEIMNLFNVVMQIYFLNHFLGNKFFFYGPLVAESYYSNSDPMSRLFPKVAKCTFYDYGPSGNIQTNDALCVLPLNIFNERIFVLLWFWFVILGMLSFMALLYRLALLSRCVRSQVLAMHAKFVERKKIELIVEECSYGDWFLLILLAKNMNPVMFQDLIEVVAQSFERTFQDVRLRMKQNGGFKIPRSDISNVSAEDLDKNFGGKKEEIKDAKGRYMYMEDMEQGNGVALKQKTTAKWQFMNMEDIEGGFGGAMEQKKIVKGISQPIMNIEEVDNGISGEFDFDKLCNKATKRKIGSSSDKELSTVYFV